MIASAGSVITIVVAVTACKKASNEPPARESVATPKPAAPTTVRPAEPPPEPPPPPPHVGTTLRVRVVIAKGDGQSLHVTATCKPTEQLTGGSCKGHYKPSGGPTVSVDGWPTFGAGWSCSGDSTATAYALCLSDSASPPPAEQPATELAPAGDGSAR